MDDRVAAREAADADGRRDALDDSDERIGAATLAAEVAIEWDDSRFQSGRSSESSCLKKSTSGIHVDPTSL